jgi:ferredoxin
MNGKESQVVSVRVERELCIGSGYCVRFAPAVFRLDDEEIAVVVDEEGGTDAERAKAADSCPAGAIYLDEEPGT